MDAQPSTGERAAPDAHLRRRIAQACLLLALAQPAVGWPYTLDQLLRLPLEKLLQVEFTPQRGSR
jgi:hypothetical protein